MYGLRVEVKRARAFEMSVFLNGRKRRLSSIGQQELRSRGVGRLFRGWVSPCMGQRVMG